MMSQMEAPIHSFKNPVIYHSKGILSTNANYYRSSRLYLKSYDDLEPILECNIRTILHFDQATQNSIFLSSNSNYISERHLALRPNHAVAGDPNLINKKILSTMGIKQLYILTIVLKGKVIWRDILGPYLLYLLYFFFFFFFLNVDFP